MPTYTYRCTKCGHEFDLFHSMSDDNPKKCEVCGKRAERLIGAGAGLVFKGSGFYITDYKHGNGTSASTGPIQPHGESNGSNGNSNGTAASNGTAKSEKKSEKASDSK